MDRVLSGFVYVLLGVSIFAGLATLAVDSPMEQVRYVWVMFSIHAVGAIIIWKIDCWRKI